MHGQKPLKSGLPHAVETMLRLLVMARGYTMPASNETQTSWRGACCSPSLRVPFIFVAHTGTIISSSAQNSPSKTGIRYRQGGSSGGPFSLLLFGELIFALFAQLYLIAISFGPLLCL
jgi:hypothetical protein